MIVTGESSGELYGALLATEIKRRWPDARVLGVGGERMRQAGVEVFAGIAGALGLIEAVAAFKAVRETFNKTVRMLRESSPQLVVLIDYPDFNFRVAKRAKELGIRVLYYVSPQVWAWRRGRVRDMAGFVDWMALVLPFEEQIYREAGIPCEFVGHPVMEEIESLPADRDAARDMLGLEKGRPCLALLPGSRRNELTRLLPVVLEVVRKFKREYPDYGFIVPVAPNVEEDDYRDYFGKLREEGAVVRKVHAALAYAASEAAVAASGTAAFQGVLVGTPLVVIYKLFPLTYLVGKAIIRVKYANLANIILDRMVVPELLQGRANAGEIMGELRPLVSETAARKGMVEELGRVRAMFEGRRPSARVAEMAGQLAGWS